MDLIVNKVMELEVVHDSNGYRVVERLARSAVVEDRLSVDDLLLFLAGDGIGNGKGRLSVGALAGENITLESRHLEALGNILLRCTVEYGGHYLPAETLCRDTKVNLKHLTDVHSGRNAEGVEHDIKRSAVGQEGHILGRKYTGNDTLVSVTSRHLISDGYLPLLCDVYPDNTVYAGGKLVAVLAGELPDIDDYSVFAVRNAERSIAHVSRLLAEDRAEKSFLGGKLGLSLRSYLTDENVACANLCSDLDNAVCVKILECVFADVRDLAGDLLRTELRVTRFVGILLDMDRGVNVITHKTLVEKYRVLVVIAFPCHESDKCVLTECNLTICGAGTVGNDLTFIDALADADDRALIYARSLIGTLEFYKVVGVLRAVLAADDDLIRRYGLNRTRILRNYDNSGVNGSLVFHTGSDNRRIRNHKRNRLLLHVRSHKCSGVIVVLEEGDHCSRNGNHHLRRNVHEVDAGCFNLDDLVAVARRNALIHEAVILIERLVCLSDNVFILNVSRHVHDLVGDDAGFAVNAAVRSLDEAVLAYACIRCE